jgi:hypothetical protein
MANGAHMVAQSDFYHEVVDAFRALVEAKALTIESSSYNGRDFGNASIVLAGPGFRVRVSRDRGEPDADVASDKHPDSWFPLEWVIAAAIGERAPKPRLMTPREAAERVAVYFDRIRSALEGPAAEATKLTLDGFANDRMSFLEGNEWRN